MTHGHCDDAYRIGRRILVDVVLIVEVKRVVSADLLNVDHISTSHNRLVVSRYQSSMFLISADERTTNLVSKREWESDVDCSQQLQLGSTSRRETHHLSGPVELVWSCLLGDRYHSTVARGDSIEVTPSTPYRGSLVLSTTYSQATVKVIVARVTLSDSKVSIERYPFPASGVGRSSSFVDSTVIS